jgi:hypothetical protein
MAAGAARPRGEARARVGERTGAGHGVRRTPGPLDRGARGRACASVSWAGLACGCGPKVRRRPTQAEKSFSFYFSIPFFPNFQNATALNQFLSNKMVFFGNGPKMKVA